MGIGPPRIGRKSTLCTARLKQCRPFSRLSLSPEAPLLYSISGSAAVRRLAINQLYVTCVGHATSGTAVASCNHSELEKTRYCSARKRIRACATSDLLYETHDLFFGLLCFASQCDRDFTQKRELVFARFYFTCCPK